MTPLLAFLTIFAFGSRQPEIEPLLRAAVEQFFAAQEAESVDDYLALWSPAAQQPQPEQLRFIFSSGDDTFIDLRIDRVTVSDAGARVRVSVTRVRTTLPGTNPDGSRRIFSTPLQLSLAYVKERGAWKLLREGSPSDELAGALTSEADASRRAAMLTEEPDLLNARLLESLSRRADALAQTARYRPAQDIYQRALEVARAMRDRKGEGQMLQNLANSLYFQRDYPGALSAYEQRLSLERDAVNEEGIASALLGIATIRYATHEYATALAGYREALAIQERLDDELLVATTLLSTGNVLYLQGDFEGAIGEYRRAEILKRKYFDLIGATTALEGLGRTYAAQGDLAAALVAFSSVLDEGRTRNDASRQGTALQSIGEIHFRLGNLDAARLAFDEGRKQFEFIKDLANAGRAWQGTAVTELIAARFSQAEVAYMNSQRLCLTALPNRDAECMARALVGLAFAQAAQQRFEEAIASYRRSIVAFGDLKAVEAAARAQVGLAEALSGRKDHVAALVEAGNARRTATVLGSDDLLWRALISQARAERSLRRPADAAAAALAAVAAVQRMAARSAAQPGELVPRDSAAAFVTSALLQAEAGDAVAAFQTVELMRAHALRVALTINERDIAGGMTEDERADERTAAGELRALVAQLTRARSLPRPDAPRIAKLEVDLRAASDKRQALQQRLFARVPELRTWRGLAPAATVEEVGAILKDDGALLVEFVVDDHDLLILTAERIAGRVVFAAHVVPSERQTIAARVARAVEPAVLADAATWRKVSADLFALVPSPVRSQLAAARSVTIVPDDMLWRVPFEAMPVEGRYLADLTTVQYAPSVTALVRAPEFQAPAQLRVLMVASPELSSGVTETLKRTAPSWVLRPGGTAETETARVREAVGPGALTSLTGAAATEDALRAEAASSSVLHLAAPFRINAASPPFSPVLLAQREDADRVTEASSRNGIFETREVPAAGIHTRVALFSDPSTMSMRDGAGAVPVVQWMWRAGGVETLILRRWESDERATNDLLASFYQLLRAGRTAPEAMALASAAARKNPVPEPPAVWAGWLVLSGR
ncbi:MAG: CHAT domain-containing protein [Vicinamibacterales bacterium]